MNQMLQCQRHRVSFDVETDELGGTCFRIRGPAARTVELIIGLQADGG